MLYSISSVEIIFAFTLKEESSLAAADSIIALRRRNISKLLGNVTQLSRPCAARPSKNRVRAESLDTLSGTKSTAKKGQIEWL